MSRLKNYLSGAGRFSKQKRRPQKTSYLFRQGKPCTISPPPGKPGADGKAKASPCTVSPTLSKLESGNGRANPCTIKPILTDF
jgi:hypothetical protein